MAFMNLWTKIIYSNLGTKFLYTLLNHEDLLVRRFYPYVFFFYY